jgi:hypothetical protein
MEDCMRRIDFVVVTVAASAFMAGCGDATIPEPQFSDAKASVRAAEAVGAQHHPDAALHVKMAKDEIKIAQRLIRDDEEEEAVRALERARADAEVALAVARTAELRVAAQNAIRKVQALEREASSR